MQQVGKKRYVSLVLATLSAGACAPPPAATDAGVFSKNPSKSSTIAMSEDGKWVITANAEDDSISIFNAADNTRTALVKVGDEPSGVVIAGDSKTAYVSNKGSATVQKITNIDTTSPTASTPLDVGSEPVGLALSPSGKKLFVAEFAEGRVSVINTADMSLQTGNIPAPANPRGLLVTNNGDANDDDEFIVVPEFYGEAISPEKEAKDDGRRGRVRFYKVSDLSPDTPIVFEPVDTGLPQDAAPTVPQLPTKTSPNQFYSVATFAGKIFVTSISASPAPPSTFAKNVYAVLYVGDIATRTATGSYNLTKLALDAANLTTRPLIETGAANDAERFRALGDIVDIAFRNGSGVSYVVSRASDAVQRISWNADATAISEFGSAAAKQIKVDGDDTKGKCQNPTGIVVNADATRAYLNCWVTRRLGVLDLTTQTLLTTVEASNAPTGDEVDLNKGRRDYFTGRARWSKNGEGWSSCASCHPDATLSDNITWAFGSGPRQTVAQDGSFSHGIKPQKQRPFNWSAIFDEHHDFERNVRDTSGGIGVLTKPAAGKTVADCGNIANEVAIELTETRLGLAGPTGNKAIVGFATPLKELTDTTLETGGTCGLKDWDSLDNFVKKLRPSRGLRSLDTAAVGRGRALFATGGCDKCHGGAGWTVARRFFTPSTARNGMLTTEVLPLPGAPFLASWWVDGTGGITGQTQVQAQPAGIAPNVGGVAPSGALAPTRLTCNIRRVETFGRGFTTDPADVTLTDALEKKPIQKKVPAGATNSLTTEDIPGTDRALGAGGFSPPSLYGLAFGAPYLHHGAVKTLDELFTEARWSRHTSAGNTNFAPTAAEVADLKAFLLSIDATTTEFDIATGLDICPAN